MVPQTVVYFTAYDQLKVRLGLTQGQHNMYAPMVAGMSARGEFAAFLTSVKDKSGFYIITSTKEIYYLLTQILTFISHFQHSNGCHFQKYF